MTVSVIALVPAYNPNPVALKETLQSLLNQSHPTEICLIDDGSLEAVPDQHDSRIHLLRLPNNSGITVALKRGVEYALDNGFEYVCRLDVGDSSYPYRISKQLEYARLHPELDLIGAHSRVTDTFGSFRYLHGTTGGSKAIRRQLWKSAPFKHSTFFVPSETFRKYGNYDPKFNGSEDNELMQRISKTGKIGCMHDVLIEYVDDPTGISATRRNLQLRMRLKALLKYRHPFSVGWYLGVCRTILLMVTPHSLAKKLSNRLWRKKSILEP